MTAVEGYYNGKQIVMDESVRLRRGQRVIVTILNSPEEHMQKKSVDLGKYMGRGEKMFNGNVDGYVKGLRSDDRV